MKSLITIFGILTFAHGIFWGAIRFIRPTAFNKAHSLDVLAQKLRITRQTTYFACFVIAPLVVGAILLTLGMNGFSFFKTVQ